MGVLLVDFFFCFFFFNDTATTEIYTLSLHDALPISIPTPGSLDWRRARRTTGRSPRRLRCAPGCRRPPLEWLASMEPEEFRDVFRGSAIKRTKWAGLVRNACIALGNAQIDRKTAA